MNKREDASTVRGRKASEHIYVDDNGVYRWIYRLDLRKNPTQFFTAIKALALCLGIFGMIAMIVSVFDGSFDLYVLLIPLWLGLFMGVIMLISWPIYIAVAGGEYWIMFTKLSEISDKRVYPRKFDYSRNNQGTVKKVPSGKSSQGNK